MRKISRKSKHTLGYAMVGVGAAAFVGAITALVVKSRKEDREFREYLSKALDEEFEAVDSDECEALQVILVPSDGSKGCECGCCDCGDCCDVGCECECCSTCDDDHENACVSENAAEDCELEHGSECTCDKCKVEETPDEVSETEAKPEKPTRKSKKLPE